MKISSLHRPCLVPYFNTLWTQALYIFPFMWYNAPQHISLQLYLSDTSSCHPNSITCVNLEVSYILSESGRSHVLQVWFLRSHVSCLSLGQVSYICKLIDGCSLELYSATPSVASYATEMKSIQLHDSIWWPCYEIVSVTFTWIWNVII